MTRVTVAIGLAMLCAACVACAAGGDLAREPSEPREPSAAAPSSVAPPPVTEPSQGPGRQPPLPDPSEVRVRTAVDAIAFLTSGVSEAEAAEQVGKQLATYGWTVARAGSGVVATRSDVSPVRPGRPWQLVVAPLDSPAGVGVLLTVAEAFSSRSVHLPTVLLVGQESAYTATLTSEQRSDLAETIRIRVPDDSSSAALERAAVALVERV